MSKYKETIDSMVWSHSRIECYAVCAFAFYLKYILKNDDLYLPEGNFFSDLGTYNHKIFEKVFKFELNAEDSLDYYLKYYDDNVLYETSPSIMEKAYEQCADYYAAFDTDWLAGFDVLGVEKEIHTEINGRKFVGYIDLLLEKKDTKDIYIIDHKSSAYPFKVDGKTVLKKAVKSFESYKRQMYLYSKAVFEEYGRFPKQLMWNHFKDNKIATIPFNMDDYGKSLQWYDDMINKIREDDVFDGNFEYFYCTRLCDFRNSCEYAQNQDD